MYLERMGESLDWCASTDQLKIEVAPVSKTMANKFHDVKLVKKAVLKNFGKYLP